METRRCRVCGNKKTEDLFGVKFSGKPYATCIDCRDKIKTTYKQIKFNPELAESMRKLTDQSCVKCCIKQDILNFKMKADGSLTKTCKQCCEKQNDYAKRIKKENRV